MIRRKMPNPVLWPEEVQPGDVVVIRYEGPKGGPGMVEMLSPDQRHHGHGFGR